MNGQISPLVSLMQRRVVPLVLVAFACLSPRIGLAQGGATLAVAPSGSAPAGSTVTIKWTGPNSPGDYITVVRRGARPNDYLGYQATSDGRAAVNPLSIVLPAEPGAYEIRYMLGTPRSVLAAVPYEVVAVAATIDGPANVAPGATFELSWSGPNNGGDWLTIVASGAAPRAYGSYIDARIGREDARTGSRSATLRAPAQPGRYELRYVQQGRVVIGTRPIEVAAGAVSNALPPRGAPTPVAPLPEPVFTKPEIGQETATLSPGGATRPSSPRPEPVFTKPDIGSTGTGGDTGSRGGGAGTQTTNATVAGSSGSAIKSIAGASRGGGGLTAAPPPTTVTTPIDPPNFRASQTAPGTVLLQWDAVPGAGSYLLGGPGTDVGITVAGTSRELTGIPSGAQEWTVATMYNPGGILTTRDKWSTTTLTVSRPTSGLYRVTVTALLCGQPTLDVSGTLQLLPGQTLIATGDPDGPGDEVLAAAFVRRFNRVTRQLIDFGSRRTRPYGDISSGQNRLQGGTQTSTGGVKAGDWIPGNASIVRVSPATESSLPWKVWEDRLTDGNEALLISPSIWEHDGGDSAFNAWVQSQTILNETIFEDGGVQNRVANQTLAPLEVGVVPYVPAPNDRSDYPIGRRPGGTAGVIPNVTVVLTREIIEKALSSTWATAQPPVVPGLVLNIPKPGILVLNFTDQSSSNAPASYSMILQIEKVSD
jgi:hypothetical protein